MSTQPTTVNPQIAYIGAILLADVDDARELVTLVDESDFDDENARQAHRAASELARAGVRPDPVTVLALTREYGVFAEANRIQIYARCLIDAAERCPNPLSGKHYAVQVVQNAYRRDVAATGQRLAQIADTTPMADLDQNISDWVERLRARRVRLGAHGLVVAR